MARKGDCWESTQMEAFWGRMKYEWLHKQHFRTRDEASAAVFEYIENRLHELNIYLIPEDITLMQCTKVII